MELGSSTGRLFVVVAVGEGGISTSGPLFPLVFAFPRFPRVDKNQAHSSSSQLGPKTLEDTVLALQLPRNGHKS